MVKAYSIAYSRISMSNLFCYLIIRLNLFGYERGSWYFFCYNRKCLVFFVHVFYFYHFTFFLSISITQNEEHFNVDQGSQTLQKWLPADIRVVMAARVGYTIIVWYGRCKFCLGSRHSSYRTQPKCILEWFELLIWI